MADNQQYIDWAKANISGWDSLDTEKQNAVIQKRSAEVWAESNISNWASVDKEKRNKIIQKRIGESGGNNNTIGTQDNPPMVQSFINNLRASDESDKAKYNKTRNLIANVANYYTNQSQGIISDIEKFTGVAKSPYDDTPMTPEQQRFEELGGLGKLGGTVLRTVARIPLGLTSMASSMAGKLADPSQFAPEGSKFPLWDVAKAETSGILDMITDLPAQAHYGVMRAFGNEDPSQPFGEGYKESINRLYEAPESPIFGAGMLRGGVGKLTNVAKRKGLLPVEPDVKAEAKYGTDAEFKRLAKDKQYRPGKEKEFDDLAPVNKSAEESAITFEQKLAQFYQDRKSPVYMEDSRSPVSKQKLNEYYRELEKLAREAELERAKKEGNFTNKSASESAKVFEEELAKIDRDRKNPINKQKLNEYYRQQENDPFNQYLKSKLTQTIMKSLPKPETVYGEGFSMKKGETVARPTKPTRGLGFRPGAKKKVEPGTIKPDVKPNKIPTLDAKRDTFKESGKKMVVEDTNIDKIKDILVKDEIKSLSGTIKNRINNSIMKKDVDGVMSILKQNTLLQQEEIHKIAKQVRTGELTDPSLRLAANDTKVPSPNVVGQPHTFLDAPVVTRGEEAVLKSAKKLDPNSKLEALKNQYANPIWWTEETGTKEIILYPVREASHKVALGRKAFEEEFKGFVKKRFSFGSRDVASERIGIHAIAQQKGGDAILRSMGKEVPTLNKAEVETYEHIRNNLELAHGNVNSARKMAGLPPIPKQENYFTFWRKLESELENGHTIESLRPGMFSKENILKAKESSFRFGKKRILDNYGEVSLDAFSIYQKYMNSAIKHKEFTPVIGKLRQMLDGKFHSGFKLKEDNPVLYDLINNYTNDLAGVRDVKLGKFLESVIDKINHNMTIAVLSYNVRSAMIQPTALVNSYIELGPKWVAMGIRDAAKPSMRKFAKETSETLLDREFDYSMMEAMKGLTGKIGAVKKGAAKVGMLPLKILDGETAQITWLAGYQKATKALGMNKAQAKKYADDIVIQTQASGSLIDRPAVQRTALGRSINQYQTFVINNWNFLGRKVLGIKNPDMTKRQVITKLARYIAASLATGVLFEDVLNVRSPLPDPVHSYINAKNRGEDTPKALLDAGLEFVEVIPTIGGGIKYGSNILGAGAQTATDIGQIATGKATTEKSLETLGKILGVPGTVQAKKLVRYTKRKKMSYKK